MKRTLAGFARACGGELAGADRAYNGVSTDTRTLKPGELFVALRGPRFNANDFVAAAETAGAAGAVVDTRLERALATDRGARHAGRIDAVRRRLARAVLAADRRRRRQQRQDHGQGNGRRHSRAPRGDARDARQSQQSHRRAAHAAPARRRPSPRGHRDRRQSSRRSGRAGGAHASHGGTHHQRRCRASRGLRQHRRRGARRGRNGRGPRAVRHRGDQCRRRLRGAVARHDARARGHLRRRQCGRLLGARPAHQHRRRRLRHALRAACTAGRDAHRAAPRGPPQRA